MKLRADPLPLASGYTMHLYCKYTVGTDLDHNINTHGVTFSGRSRRDAERWARRWGWRWDDDGFATCPECRLRLNATNKPEDEDQ